MSRAPEAALTRGPTGTARERPAHVPQSVESLWGFLAGQLGLKSLQGDIG